MLMEGNNLNNYYNNTGIYFINKRTNFYNLKRMKMRKLS